MLGYYNYAVILTCVGQLSDFAGASGASLAVLAGAGL